VPSFCPSCLARPLGGTMRHWPVLIKLAPIEEMEERQDPKPFSKTRSNRPVLDLSVAVSHPQEPTALNQDQHGRDPRSRIASGAGSRRFLPPLVGRDGLDC
jgi:hypothetical protein